MTNYLFDVLNQDLIRVERGEVSEAYLAVAAPDPDLSFQASFQEHGERHEHQQSKDLVPSPRYQWRPLSAQAAERYPEVLLHYYRRYLNRQGKY